MHSRRFPSRLPLPESGLPAISLLQRPTGPGQADCLTVQPLKVEKDAPCTPEWRPAAAWSQMKRGYRLAMFKLLPVS